MIIFHLGSVSMRGEGVLREYIICSLSIIIILKLGIKICHLILN